MLIMPSFIYKRRAAENDNDDNQKSTDHPDSITNLGSLTSLSSHLKRLRVENMPTSMPSRMDAAEHQQAASIPSEKIEELFKNDSISGNNHLHASILQRNEKKALGLIKLAPSFDYMSFENSEGETALHLAVKTNQPRLVRRLICAGAEVAADDDNGLTPLHLACKEGYTDIVDHLLKPVDFVEISDNNYVIPFQRIPQNMNITDNEGDTCLLIAYKHKRREVVKMLVKSGLYNMGFSYDDERHWDIISRFVKEEESPDDDNTDDEDEGECVDVSIHDHKFKYKGLNASTRVFGTEECGSLSVRDLSASYSSNSSFSFSSLSSSPSFSIPSL